MGQKIGAPDVKCYSHMLWATIRHIWNVQIALTILPDWAKPTTSHLLCSRFNFLVVHSYILAIIYDTQKTEFFLITDSFRFRKSKTENSTNYHKNKSIVFVVCLCEYVTETLCAAHLLPYHAVHAANLFNL